MRVHIKIDKLYPVYSPEPCEYDTDTFHGNYHCINIPQELYAKWQQVDTEWDNLRLQLGRLYRIQEGIE